MRFRIATLVVWLFLLLAFLGPATPTARAADYRSGQTVVIAADEVIDDDLFITAQTIEINGTINGDLIAVGNLIVHHGNVLGSAALAGQQIDIHGRVAGSIYGAGYAMTLEEGAAIGRNVIFRGFALATRPGSSVGRDIYTGAAQMVHQGQVAGDLNVYVNALEIDGLVSGDIRGEVIGKDVSTWADFLPLVRQIDDRSPFLRNLTNFMPDDLDDVFPGIIISTTARIDGDVLATETADASLALPGRLWNRLGEFIGLMILAAILIRRVPKVVPETSGELRQKPWWASLGLGAVIYILLFPLALIAGVALVLLISFVTALLSLGEFSGIVFGLTGSVLLVALFTFLFITYILTWIITGHWIGRRILAREGRDESRPWTQFLYVALGVFLLQVLHAIPGLGFIVAFLVSAFGLGAVYWYWRERNQTRASEKSPLKPAGSQ